MAISLARKEYPARVVLHGSENFEATAGQTVKLESTPAGVEVLNQTVPAGKKWLVRSRFIVEETDA